MIVANGNWNKVEKLNRTPVTKAAISILLQKSKSKGRFNIYGVEAIYASNVFKKFTRTKSKFLESAVKKANTDKCSYQSNYQMVENWCNTLGLSIDLVRLDDTDLDNLHSYLNAIGENAQIN
jgi:hypothetical protein